MKKLIILLSLFSMVTVSAQTLRETCENAYYATGYVELHQYNVTVDWSRLSDHGLEEFESIIFGEAFQYIKDTDLRNGKTVYTIKEISGFDFSTYEAGIKALQRLTFEGVSCKYAL